MAKKLKKDDKVIVIAGKDKGKVGTILSVFPKKNRVLVSGVAICAHHQRPTSVKPGGIVRKESSIHISNVAFFDSSKQGATRIGFKEQEGKDGKKERVRFMKRSGEVVVEPSFQKSSKKPQKPSK